jgi:predicted TIM-barrel fold metal-dependent hydrolase
MTDDLEHAASKYWAAEGWTPGGVIREVDYTREAKGLAPELQGIKIVDCDTHVTEPPDLFTSRAPARYKDKVPHVRRVQGIDRWFVGDRDFGAMGGNVIRADHNKLLGRCSFPTLTEGHSSAYETKARLQVMDEMGIYAQMCYHNSGVTQAGSLMALGDNELAVTIIKLYNDAAVDRQRESGQRLFTLGHVPFWDKAAMEAEAKRCLDLDIKGFVLPDTPERIGCPSYCEQHWTAFLEMCAERGASLNFHLNTAMDPTVLAWKGFSFEQTLSVVATMFCIGNAATLGNWIVSGRLDQFPKLKIGLIESGMGWVPFALEALEHQFNEMLPSKWKMLKRRPKEYFRDQFWVTYWFEEVGPKQLLETIGVNKVMFETDFPHPTSLYPGIQNHIVDSLGGYNYEVRKRVLERNAVELYNLPF